MDEPAEEKEEDGVVVSVEPDRLLESNVGCNILFFFLFLSCAMRDRDSQLTMRLYMKWGRRMPGLRGMPLHRFLLIYTNSPKPKHPLQEGTRYMTRTYMAKVHVHIVEALFMYKNTTMSRS